MKKNLPYILLLGVLLGIASFLFLKNRAPKEDDQKAFACKQMDNLTRIELKDRLGKEIILNKKDGVWYLNENEKPDKEALKTLLEVLENIYPASPAPDAAVDVVIKDMIGRSTKVSLFINNDKKPYKVYSVGGPTKDNDGTYMILEINGKETTRPYIVKLAGFRGFLTYHYPTDKNVWRSKEYLSYLPNEVKKITVNHIENPSQSFEISRTDDDFIVKFQGNEYTKNKVYQNLAQEMFTSFGHLNFEKFEENIEKKDSIMQHLHYLDFEVEDVYGKKHALSVYHVPLGNLANISMDSQGNPVKYDIDRLYALNHDTNIMMSIQFYTFGQFFIPGSSLIRPE